jgi:hypothetical protein
MKKETPKVAESVCLSHALSILALHKKQFSQDEEKRIIEAAGSIASVHPSPLELAPIAAALVMHGVRNLATQGHEKELEAMGVDYIKAVLRKARDRKIKIKSPDDIAKHLGLWFVGMTNAFLFAPFIAKEEFIERFEERPLEFENFSPLQIMYVGWTLHVLALQRFFSLLPPQVFQLSSILEIAEGWVSFEAEIYPELRRAIDD